MLYDKVQCTDKPVGVTALGVWTYITMTDAWDYAHLQHKSELSYGPIDNRLMCTNTENHYITLEVFRTVHINRQAIQYKREARKQLKPFKLVLKQLQVKLRVEENGESP